jgi:membrane protein implicated in regulation of membrane protease activity
MKKAWSSRIVLKYALLQVPAFALLTFLLLLAKHWVDLPSWFIWGLIVFWAVKDVVLFPLTWRAYDQDRSRGASSMIGAHGVAEERLAPSGYVRIGGELWQAEVAGGAPPIERGERVHIENILGLTLLVSSVNNENDSMQD